MERTVKEISAVKIPPPAIEYKGSVAMGAYTPPFPELRAEPARVVDKGEIRMGSFSPPFPPAVAK
jgi:hypothetical protein